VIGPPAFAELQCLLSGKIMANLLSMAFSAGKNSRPIRCGFLQILANFFGFLIFFSQCEKKSRLSGI
jgi:hypothetical protein